MNEWQPIETAPTGLKVLVTNNIGARDAHGRMSHVWLVPSVQTAGNGAKIAFTEEGRRLLGITHWFPLSMVNDPPQDTESP